MADVEFNGETGTIPDFAMEDTQQKILAALKKAYNLNEKDLAAAKDAINQENKNTKAQLDALNNLGASIESAAQGGGGLFSSLSKGAGAVTGILGTMAKVGGGLVAGLGTLGVAAATAAINITKGFGDDIAILAKSGAAFGELGDSLPGTVTQLRSLGLTTAEAVSAVDNFRTTMTVLGGGAAADVIREFQNITNGGAKFGRTISENIEFLAEEIQTRQMLGFFQRRSAAEEAAAAQEIMESQIQAAKMLGKSVDDIAQSVAQMFGREDFKASFARLGEDAAQTLRMTFQQFEGASLGDDMMAGLAKAFTDPIMLQSEEARQSIAALRLIDPEAADEIQRNIEGFREASARGDTAAAEAFAKRAEELTLQTAGSIAGMEQADKRRLELLAQNNSALAGTLANQNAVATALKNYGKEIEVSDALRISTEFSNIIQLLSNSFGTIYTSVQSQLAPMLERITAAFGSLDDENSPIFKFTTRLGEISNKISTALSNLIGPAESSEGAMNIVNTVLDTLGDSLEWLGDQAISLATALSAPEDESSTFVDRIFDYFLNNIVYPLGNAIRNWWSSVDLWDLLFGDSDKELVENASSKVEKGMKAVDQMSIPESEKEKARQQVLDNAVSDIQETASDRGYDPAKTLQLIQDAGIKVTELSGQKLLELFPDPATLQEAITGVYGSDIESANAAWAEATGRMKEAASEIQEAELGLVGKAKSLVETDEETKAREDAAKNTADAFKAASERIMADTGKRNDPGQGVLAPSAEKPKEQQTEQPKQPTSSTKDDLNYASSLQSAQVGQFLTPEQMAELGNQPSQAPSPGIMTSMPEDETPTAQSPTSADGTPTQEVKPADSSQKSDVDLSIFEQYLPELVGLMRDVKKNTRGTTAGIQSMVATGS